MAMMEPPCAPPCPPGPTSLALSTSSSSISLASERVKFNSSTTSETSLNPTQGFQDLIELSPDSGNGEELDEFDSLKSPVKAADVNCEERRPSITAALEAQIISESGVCEKSDNLSLGNSQCKNLTSDANEIGKPSVFQIDPDVIRAKEKAPGMQITPQSDSTSSDDSQSQENQYSPAYNFGQLESSLLASCNPSFQCGPFSSACGSVGGLGRCNEINGPFSLPEGADPVLDAGTYNAPYLLGADGSTTIRPFSMVPNGDNMRGYPAAMRFCAPVEVQQQPSNPIRNPSYPRCLRGRPTRRYTNHEVVRKQPTAGGLLTNSCDLITTHPGQCPCVNPGMSHTCAARVSDNSLLGVLNPMFEQEASNNQVNNTSMPLLPRKYSMDYSLSSRGLQLPERTRAPVSIKSLSACYPNNSRTNLSLPYSPQVMTCRGSDTISSICGPAQRFPTTSPSEAHLSNCQIQDQQHHSTSIVGQHPLNGVAVKTDSQIDGLSHSKTNVSRTTMSYARPPLVTSPDWFSLMAPPRDSYTQRLFTPDDLQDELLYPAPYGLKSEIYQNLNAREADFVLQKPSRKPRTEPLPSSCLPMTPKKRSESPEIKEGIIQPLATEDEEAQIEGARESQRVSLKDRRKSSLEKIYIPKAGDPIDSVLNVKIDNFDRDEYVKYKKSFGENDLVIPSFTELLKKNASSSMSPSLDINPCATDDSTVLPKTNSQTAASNNNTSPGQNYDSKISLNKISKDYNQPSYNDKHTSMNSPVLDSAKSPETYKEKQSLREIRNWNSRTRIVPMPKQRSLEETENHTPSEEKRKQSLPTEDLFGLRRPRTNRKASLAALSESNFHKINSSGAAAFSPVSEADEIISKFSEYNCKQTYSANSNFYVDDHSKRSISQPKKDTSSREKGKEKKKYKGTLDTEFLSGSPKSRARSENSIRHQHHHHQRLQDTTEARHHHHHHHHQRQENPKHQHHHQRPHKATEPHQRPHATKEPQHPMKSTGSGEDEMGHKSGFYGSSRKARRKMGESHTNRMAPLSPPGPRSPSDLFSQPGCESQEPRTQRRATVPYEPLVDVLTPSTPDMPSPASGATRKRQHRRRKNDHHHRHHHHHLESQHNPMAEGGDLSVVLSSTSSSPPLLPVSRSSSSASSSSTLTSPSGSPQRGSPPPFSSSSESSSSGTDSSSDSSSESSSSSSSSDSSDIEDLIL